MQIEYFLRTFLPGLGFSVCLFYWVFVCMCVLVCFNIFYPVFIKGFSGTELKQGKSMSLSPSPGTHPLSHCHFQKVDKNKPVLTGAVG